MSPQSALSRNRRREPETITGIGPSKRCGMYSKLLTIGQLARETGVTPRAIRYYERLGLIETPVRTDTNYRLFDGDSIARVNFIAKCRSLDFSTSQISGFLHIIRDPDHTCTQAADITRRHLELIDAKMRELVEIKRALAQNLACCTDQEDTECAVLDFLQD